MNIEDEHWEYTEKVITIGMVISSICGLEFDDSDLSQRKFEQIIKCLETLYKESFRHGYKHCKEDKK